LKPGGEGLELARTQKPDLILLDLYLPDMMLSADATIGQPERLLRAGAQGYVTKPIDVKVFLETVDRTLREAVASKAARP
jgi:CheY-like chemotaxis protein